MAIIENIPDAMIKEHVRWHESHRPPPPNPTGLGEEFLVWHSSYIERFLTWVNSLPERERPAPAAIAPWTEIPAALKGSSFWNQHIEHKEQCLQDMANFDTHDDLGRFIVLESLHSFLHNATAEVFKEDVVAGLESPRSTYFWQIHGLIESWSQAWLSRPPPTHLKANLGAEGGGSAELTVIKWLPKRASDEVLVARRVSAHYLAPRGREIETQPDSPLVGIRLEGEIEEVEPLRICEGATAVLILSPDEARSLADDLRQAAHEAERLPELLLDEPPQT